MGQGRERIQYEGRKMKYEIRIDYSWLKVIYSLSAFILSFPVLVDTKDVLNAVH
jgi:hypothetical protein